MKYAVIGLGEFGRAAAVELTKNGAEVIDHLLALTNERAATINKRARRRLLSEHTFLQRATELEALLEGVDAQWALTTAL